MGPINLKPLVLFHVVVAIVCSVCIVHVAHASRPSVGDVSFVRASYYGGDDGFNGKVTANGSIFRDTEKTAAHRTLPFCTVVKLTNPEINVSKVVTITDRGPYVEGRDIDVAMYGVGKPLHVGAQTLLKMEILHVPKKPVVGICR